MNCWGEGKGGHCTIKSMELFPPPIKYILHLLHILYAMKAIFSYTPVEKVQMSFSTSTGIWKKSKYNRSVKNNTNIKYSAKVGHCKEKIAC